MKDIKERLKTIEVLLSSVTPELEVFEEQREHRREYMREYMKEYWQRNLGRYGVMKRQARENSRKPENKARIRAATKAWIENNRERYNEYAREYSRKNYVSGVRVVGKRLHPGKCELCSSTDCVLPYHHWDDTNPAKGIYLCFECHMFAESVDKGKLKYLMRYYHLQDQVEAEFTESLLVEV